MTTVPPPSERGFETRAIHAGQRPDPTTGAVMTPIYASSTFAHSTSEEDRDYVYSRVGNPTRDALEANLASLESGASGRAFASGMAAIDAVIRTLDPGSHVVVGEDVYGGTYRLFTETLSHSSLTFEFVDATDPAAIASAVGPSTELVWIESPTNPLLRIVDVRAIAELAHEVGALCAVDNTFATPFLQRPLELGADLVIHSLTKYLGGHSDVIGGAVVTDVPAVDERLGFYQKAVGAVPGPLTCFLVLRGTKTLPVRMQRHCETAGELARWLVEHPAVRTVHYPGLPSHPHVELAAEQMRDAGGMIGVELDASAAEVREIISSTAVWTLAESLGGVESLIGHPATMSHASMPAKEREAAGVTDQLIRLSVGLESPSDLRADLEHAFETGLGP